MLNNIAIFATFLLGALGASSQQGGLAGLRTIRASSVNWSGVVIQGQNISSVSGTFPVLEAGIPNVNETGKHAYSASVWIGIDGYNKTICPDGGLWQAGVLTQHHNLTGEIWYQPLYATLRYGSKQLKQTTNLPKKLRVISRSSRFP